MSCPNCGAPVASTDTFCEACGTTVRRLGAAPTVDLGGSAPPDPPDPVEPVEPVDPDPVATATAADPSNPTAATALGAPVDAAAVDGTGPALLDKTSFLPPPRPPTPDPAVTAPVGPCAECGGPVGPDGYCTVCGVRAQSERDHWREDPASWVGAVCDRGVRHVRNEDGMATAATEPRASFAALVVCDGVSTSTRSEVASLAAARAARDVLDAARPSAPDDPTARAAHWGRHLTDACRAASEETRRAAEEVGDPGNPPSCTFVAAVVQDGALVTGWVGDSRAYWLPDDGVAVQLTEDDSWVTERVALGVPRAEAEADGRAHAITRWLGADSAVDTPRTSSLRVDGVAGWVLVCSDGLWNYCSPAPDLRALVSAMVAGHPEGNAVAPGLLAADLVAWANGQGGHDNITVALARLEAGDAERWQDATLEITVPVRLDPPDGAQSPTAGGT